LTPTEDTFALLCELYRDTTGSHRDLRRSDRLREDLAVDSLIAVELLCQLEDRCQVELLNDPATHDAHTVGELCELVDRLASARAIATDTTAG
jgi:acyl carrier protein